MSEAPVLEELDDDGVLLLTLNRPEKKNAFDDPQWDALRDALDRARRNERVAVVVVTGAGRDFSAGQDLTAFGKASEPREDGKPNGYYGCMDALFAFDKPLLAAARGVGVGIGITFLFACDVVYVGESVRLRLPFVSLGLVPEAASSYLLQAAIGRQRAAELFFTAEWIDAARAVELADEFGSLAAFFWSYEPESVEGDRDGEWPIPSTTPTSVALAKELKRRGWSFVGPTTVYAFMQAMGLVNDHIEGCAARADTEARRERFRRPRAR